MPAFRLPRLSASRACVALLLAFVSAQIASVCAPATAWAKRSAHPEVAAAETLFEDERYYDAFGKLSELSARLKEGSPERARAEYLLGETLFRLRLYQSSFRVFDQIAIAGPSHPHYGDAIRAFLQIHRVVPGDLATLERLAAADERTYPKNSVDEILFHVGQHFYYHNDWAKALDRLTRVQPKGGEHYLKARHLAGVIQVIKNDARPAADLFKDILRYEERFGSPSYYPRYRELAYLALARVFYSTGQYETAVRYYDQITEGSDVWLDSLFELGWAYFQLNRMDRVMGHLHTLNSPYFEDRYYPEARVLAALIYFRTCRFEETAQTVKQFLDEYRPLKKELDVQLGKAQSPTEFYSYLARLSKGGAKLSVPLRRIFAAALGDKKLNRLFQLVAETGRELEGLEKLKRNTNAQRAAQTYIEDLLRMRGVLTAEAGDLARKRLTGVNEELTEIIRQGLRIKYETSKASRGNITPSVRKEMQETAEAASAPREVDEEHVEWPFDGTYWKDELGGYSYTIESKCKLKK